MMMKYNVKREVSEKKKRQTVVESMQKHLSSPSCPLGESVSLYCSFDEEKKNFINGQEDEFGVYDIVKTPWYQRNKFVLQMICKFVSWHWAKCPYDVRINTRNEHEEVAKRITDDLREIGLKTRIILTDELPGGDD